MTENERNHTCCFTGHRDMGNFSKLRLGHDIEVAVRKCLDLDIYRFLCGGARGFDAIAAAHVHRLQRTNPKIELHLILPCRDMTRGWKTEDVRLHYAILGVANSVTYLNDTYYDGCMRERNVYMIEHSTACICYYNEKNSRSGTGQTVRLAQKKGLLLTNVLPPPKKDEDTGDK